MITVEAKFTEKFWDNAANAEIPMQTAFIGEALSVEAQKDGINVQQKFKGRNNGIFLRYKDLSVLKINEAEVDLTDLDSVESAIAEANATKKITFVGDVTTFFVGEDVSSMGEPEDIDITDCFTKDGVTDKVLFIKEIGAVDMTDQEGTFEIREITAENAEVMIKKVEVVDDGSFVAEEPEEMLQVTVRGMQGNVTLNVKAVFVPDAV